jgi:SPASM domain peptide maturase of grasp-with-spasm system
MERAFGFSKDCFVVRGHLRSAIYDTRRQAYSLIDNVHADELKDFEGCGETEVRTQMNPDLLRFVLEQEFAFFWPSGLIGYFSDISMDFFHPAPLSNAILEGRGLHVLDRIHMLLKTGCRYFAILLREPVSLRTLDEYLSGAAFETVPTLELYLEQLDDARSGDIREFIRRHPFIASVNIHNAPANRFFIENQVPVAVSRGPLERPRPVISPDVFFVNLQLLIESRHHNPYFHRKIYIGPEGDIRNAPEDSRIFGNIRDIADARQIAGIVEHSDFRRYWDIPKDNIDVCRDCEFRYMCTDARVPSGRPDGSWFFPTECAYNPYICKWENEDGFMSLEDCGVHCDHDGFRIDESQLRVAQAALWNREFSDTPA